MADASTAKRNLNPSSSETVANNDDLLNQILLYLPIRSLLPASSCTAIPTFVHDPSDLRILQSCNGLLLCRGLHLYIYNPTTSQFATLPQPPRRVLTPLRCFTTFYAYNLAFDPSKSPHYKVVSVNFSCGLPDHYELEIYSSETGLWSPSGDPFTGDVSFNLGVFGMVLFIGFPPQVAILCISMSTKSILKQCRCLLSRMVGRRGGSERDYCGWFVKYRVDIDAILNAFPEMIRSSLDPSDLHYYQLVILDLIREENDEESFLVLHIPGKVIRDKSFRELFDVPRRPDNECFSFEGCIDSKMDLFSGETNCSSGSNRFPNIGSLSSLTPTSLTATKSSTGIASGLFLQLHRWSRLNNPEYEFVSFNDPLTFTPPFRTLTFIPDPSGLKILQSWNGLLFCCSSQTRNLKRK
ncbi:hypothetical protein HYC85_028958 [Camellia sinensis]|uniref:F-box associated beta-propeller type 1 domain-containing protein n=1 Tax=Camellia sinensis TaxID=4442 RepID=A0A7J7FXB7_CAMSI|nr:hypothetical protein HYC85_028958 [Camellia sinensis]